MAKKKTPLYVYKPAGQARVNLSAIKKKYQTAVASQVKILAEHPELRNMKFKVVMKGTTPTVEPLPVKGEEKLPKPTGPENVKVRMRKWKRLDSLITSEDPKKEFIIDPAELFGQPPRATRKKKSE